MFCFCNGGKASEAKKGSDAFFVAIENDVDVYSLLEKEVEETFVQPSSNKMFNKYQIRHVSNLYGDAKKRLRVVNKDNKKKQTGTAAAVEEQQQQDKEVEAFQEENVGRRTSFSTTNTRPTTVTNNTTTNYTMNLSNRKQEERKIKKDTAAAVVVPTVSTKKETTTNVEEKEEETKTPVVTSVSLLDIGTTQKKKNKKDSSIILEERKKSVASIFDRIDALGNARSFDDIEKDNNECVAQSTSPVNLYEDAKRRLKVVKNKENNNNIVQFSSVKASNKTVVIGDKNKKTPLKSRQQKNKNNITKRTPLVERKRHVLQARQLHLGANV